MTGGVSAAPGVSMRVLGVLGNGKDDEAHVQSSWMK